MIEELDAVRLLEPLPAGTAHGVAGEPAPAIEAGRVGTVVVKHSDAAFEVEFDDEQGRGVAFVVLGPAQVELVQRARADE